MSDTIDLVTKIDGSEYREANYRSLFGENSRTFRTIQAEERTKRAAWARMLPKGHRLRAEHCGS